MQPPSAPERQPDEHAQRRRLLARSVAIAPTSIATAAATSANTRMSAAGRERVAPRDAEHDRRHDDDVGRLEQRDAEPAERLAGDDRARRRRRRHHPPRDAQLPGADERGGDAVIDVRNMNITSWVDAPNVNCENPANRPASPTRVTVDRDAGRRSRSRPRPRPGLGPSAPAPSASATRAAVAIAATRATAASTGARSPAVSASVVPDVAQLGRAGARERARRTHRGSRRPPRACRARPSPAASPRRRLADVERVGPSRGARPEPAPRRRRRAARRPRAARRSGRRTGARARR